MMNAFRLAIALLAGIDIGAIMALYVLRDRKK